MAVKRLWRVSPVVKGKVAIKEIIVDAHINKPVTVSEIMTTLHDLEHTNAALLKLCEEMGRALENARIALGEAGSDEHLKQLTDAELGKLWIATTKQADAALTRFREYVKEK